MESVSVSEFKATCLELFEKVRRTGQPILVTKRGEPIAQVGPPPPKKATKNWLGWARGTVRITGDIVGPIMDEEDWEAAR